MYNPQKDLGIPWSLPPQARGVAGLNFTWPVAELHVASARKPRTRGPCGRCAWQGGTEASVGRFLAVDFKTSSGHPPYWASQNVVDGVIAIVTAMVLGVDSKNRPLPLTLQFYIGLQVGSGGGPRGVAFRAGECQMRLLAGSPFWQ